MSAEMAVDIQEEQQGDILILHVKGRLDAVSTPNAEKKVFEHINKGQNNVLIDMEGVDYISSAGMRMLLSTSKKLKALLGKLVICSTTPHVLDVLKMSGFDHVLDLASNEDEGLSHF